MKVLIADDSELILETLQEMLSRYGQVEIVASCKNGTDTLVAIQTMNPNLAIVDVNIPGMTGLDVLSEIRKENHTTTFIILTLYSSGYYRQQAIEGGADYFFSKEDDFEKIPGVVEGMLIKEDDDNIKNTKIKKS